jgi:hypothetical protein
MAGSNAAAGGQQAHCAKNFRLPAGLFMAILPRNPSVELLSFRQSRRRRSSGQAVVGVDGAMTRSKAL